MKRSWDSRFNGSHNGDWIGTPDDVKERQKGQREAVKRVIEPKLGKENRRMGVEFGYEEQLARKILDKNDLKCSRIGWHRYAAGMWNESDKDELHYLALDVQEKTKRSILVAKRVLEHVKARCRIQAGDFKPAVCFADGDTAILINVMNGVVRLDLMNGERELLKQDPKYLFISQLPVEYKLEARCDLFQQTLGEILTDEQDRRLFRLWFAHCLLPHSRLESFLICVGAAGSGKSTLVLHGIGSVFEGACRTGISLSKLCRDSDELRHLRGSLLNLGTEIDYRAQEDSSNLKLLVSGEPIYVCPKYVSSYELQTTCKFCFLSNRLPSFKKGSNAESRRIRLLHFANAIAGESIDPTLKDRVAKEKNGIFLWLLDVLAEVAGLTEMVQGGELSQRELRVFTLNNNPLGIFVTEYCCFGNPETLYVVKKEFVRCFKKFVELVGSSIPVSDQWIWKELYAIHPEIKGEKTDRKVVNGEQEYVLFGMDLTVNAREKFLYSGTKPGILG
jgi:P4 family phage/plasmid primase-like protien